MSKTRDREILVSQIKRAAEEYREHLVGKRFMYVFDDRYIEVIYKSQNFRHLTGVDTSLSAKRFYNYAVQKKLEASQIFFNAVHPYDLCVRKVKHIGDIATLAGSESFMLEELTTSTTRYRFGTTDLNFTLCMNREIDEQGKEKGDCFVVQSLRDEDCFAKSGQVYAVTHIFARQNDVKKYTDLLYMDSSASMKKLPDSVKSLLETSLLEVTNPRKKA